MLPPFAPTSTTPSEGTHKKRDPENKLESANRFVEDPWDILGKDWCCSEARRESLNRLTLVDSRRRRREERRKTE